MIWKKISNCKRLKRYFYIRNKNNADYISLAPIKINDEHMDEYMVTMNAVIKDKELNNIALTGGYGSGKSSIIKTYINRFNLKKNDYNIVTIGSYFNDESIRKSFPKENGTDEIKQNKVEQNKVEQNEVEQSEVEQNDVDEGKDYYLNEDEINLVNKIEQAIIRQLLFKNNAEDLLESNFKRLNSSGFRKLEIFTYLYSFYFILLFLFLNLYYKYESKITYYFNLNFPKFLAFFNKSWIDFICLVITIFLGLLGIIVLNNLLLKISKFIYKAMKNFNFSLKGTKLDLEVNYDMAFAKELREIMAFFTYNRKCEVIFFEDIDRFSTDVTLKIVEELKELNTIINNSNSVTQNVTFVYSFKEDIFRDYKDKSKFYDYIISVMPVSTFYNSYDILNETLEKVNLDYAISSKLLGIIADNLYDVRTINSIVNDFCLFVKTLKTTNYNKVFAMATVKNIYIKEYDKLLEHDNFLDKKLAGYIQKRDELRANVKEKIKNLEIQREKIKSEICTNIKELKQLLWINNFESKKSSYMIVSNGSYYYEDFMKEQFDINILRDNSAIKYSGINMFNDGEVKYDFATDKEAFFDRVDRIINPAALKKVEEEIEGLNYNLKRIGELSKEEVLIEYGKEKFNKVDLLDQLIAYGFIETDYLDYITLPPSNGLTASDNKFIFDVKHNSFSELTGITNFEQILGKLDLEYFKEIYSFNVYLLEFLLSNKKNFSSYYENIINTYRDLDDEKMRQIGILYDYNLDIYLNFIEDISNSSESMWDIFLENVSETTRITYSKLIFETTLLLNKESFIKEKKSFLEYANEYFNDYKNFQNLNILFNYTTNFKRNILRLLGPELRIRHLNEIKKEEKGFFINNGMYYYNEENMKEILGFVPTSLGDNTLKFMRKGEIFREHLINNFSLFATEYYLKSSFKISDETVIINLLKRSDITKEIKEEIIRREKFVLSDSDIDIAYYEDMLVNNHWKVSWNTISYLYGKIKMVKIADFIYKNRKELLTKEAISEATLVVKVEVMAKIVVKLLKKNSELLIIDDLMSKCLISKKFKYETFSDVDSNVTILQKLAEKDLLKYGSKTFLKHLQDASLDAAIIYLYNWYKSEKDIEKIYRQIQTKEELIKGLLLKKLEVDDKMIIILEEVKKKKEALKDLMLLAFEKDKKYFIKYNEELNNYIFSTNEKIFKTIKMTKETITFSL